MRVSAAIRALASLNLQIFPGSILEAYQVRPGPAATVRLPAML
jgi:hypothetical protein